MKKILIINFRRIGDVYTTGHLINSLHHSGDTAISLLVYRESANAAKNLKNVADVYSIDRKEIISLKTNKLFSDGFALELLFNQLEEIKGQKWDKVINYSNDLVGAYLCSYLREATDNIIGVSFDEQRNVTGHSDWELLFNNVLPTVKYTPLHFVDCYHKMLGLPRQAEGEKVITNPTHNASAFNNLNTIRKGQAPHKGAKKIVGVQLKTSDTAKDIPMEIVVEFLSLVLAENELVPILLIAPTAEEKRYAAEINKSLSEELVIVEADLQAIASVLMNIDLLVTPDTAIKHIADLTDTPVVEVSMGNAPFLKQGSYSLGSLILTDIVTSREFKKSDNAAETKSNITSKDILCSVNYFFEKSKTARPAISNGVTLYTCSFDQLGACYKVVGGSVNAQTEIHRLMSRQIISSVYNKNNSMEVYTDIIDFGLSAVTEWCQKEKANITIVMKDLLGTLRSLLLSMESKKGSADFVINLERLISHSDQTSSMQIIATMFKTKIELIVAKSVQENAKEVEINLYNFKADIQKVILCIKNMEDKVAEKRKNDFANRAQVLPST